MRIHAGPAVALVVFCISTVLCVAWTLIAGKDLNWDLLHYHYYDAHALLEWRIRQDYFAASTQSYLNPLGYVPFYLMVSAGWHRKSCSRSRRWSAASMRGLLPGT